MGWWGYNIMEGDTPLDCESEIIEFLADPALVEAQSDDNWDELQDEINKSGFDALNVEANVFAACDALQAATLCDFDSNIGMQVLGEMIMCSGAAFPQRVREACKTAANTELDDNEKALGWHDKDERAKCLRAFIKRVDEHVDGTPSEPTSEGLFAKMFA